MKLKTDWGVADVDPYKVTSFNARFDPLNNRYTVELYFDPQTSMMIAVLSDFDETMKVLKELYFSCYNTSLKTSMKKDSDES